jgi:arginase
MPAQLIRSSRLYAGAPYAYASIAPPGAESTDGRNTGPTLDQAGEALRVAARDPRLMALSIGELNPTRSAGDPEAIPLFAGVLAGVLAAAAS